MQLHKESGIKGFRIAREKLKKNPEALKRKNEAFLRNAEKYREIAAFEHKVVAVRRTNRYEEMYDIEVKDFHNFALSSGVFVHNSIDSVQILKERGIDAGILSVDKDTKSYDTLKELLHTHRIDFYPDEIFQREYQRLELIRGKKIDHPHNGSKDVADAVAGVCYNVVNENIKPSVGFMWLGN